MKTNIIMKSEDRKLFGHVIRQETKTGFLNLSDLQSTYDSERLKNGWTVRRTSEILQSDENRERIHSILKERGMINTEFPVFIQMLDNEGGFFHFLKKIGVYKTSGARHTKTTWCDPYIWMLAALELHPVVYAKTVIWLTDTLILNRIEAGNFYRGLTDAASKFKNVDYIQLAKALNYIIFGKHEPGIRNFGTHKQLRELAELEKKMAFAIDMGYIISFDQLINDLRKIYSENWMGKLHS